MGITISARTFVNNLTIGSTPTYFTIPTNNLILYLDAANRNSYPGTGTVWYDLSPSGNTCYITGATFNSLGYISSFYFSGSSTNKQYVRLPVATSPFYDTALDNWSISFWMKSSQINGGTIYGETGANAPDNGSSSYVPMIYLNTNGNIRMELYWAGNTNVYRTGTTIVNDSKYHNVVVVRSGNTQSLYVDAVLDAPILTASRVFSFRTYHWIGSGFAGTRPGGVSSNIWYNGEINNFVIYTKSLTQTEITSLYNTFRPRFT